LPYCDPEAFGRSLVCQVRALKDGASLIGQRNAKGIHPVQPVPTTVVRVKQDMLRHIAGHLYREAFQELRTGYGLDDVIEEMNGFRVRPIAVAHLDGDLDGLPREIHRLHGAADVDLHLGVAPMEPRQARY